jgi:2-dehydro-3-deoxyphosphooctonate aldolase (KDO 8-P synthase)
MEVHQDPDSAPSDGPNMVILSELEEILKPIIEIDNLIKEKYKGLRKAA